MPLTTLTPMKRLIRLLNADRKEIGYIYLYAILVGLIALAGPLGVQAVIGLIAGGEFNVSMIVLVAVITAATIGIGLLKVMQFTVTETLQRRLFSRAAFEFAYRLPRIEFSAFRPYYPPELVNRFFDTVTVQKGLPKILMDFSGALMQIIFGLILVALYHPFFAVFGAVLAILLFILIRVLAPSGIKTSLNESKYKYMVAGWLEDVARANNTFKLAGGERLTMNRTNELLNGYLGARAAHFRILLFHYGGLITFQALVTASFLLLGGFLVINNQINIGQFVAAEIVILSIVSSAEKMIFSLEVIYDTLTGVEKLGNVTDLPLEVGGELHFDKIDTGKGISLKLNDINFAYQEYGRKALSDISLEVAANERVCISGFNRSGRSTLVQILAGLRFDFEGQLNFNNIPSGNLDLDSLRQVIGDYSPHEDIIPGTLIDNICLGHPDVDFDDIQWALSVADLNSWITEQNDGYDTMLLAEGLNVPRSVRARLLLARAIVRRPRLLVLGSLLDQLEPGIREAIVQKLTAEDRTWTVFIVSNDPNIAKACDRQIVMRKGEIIAIGKPAEVLQYPEAKEIWSKGYTSN